VKAAALLDDDRGAEQMEYLLIFAAIVLPMAVAARLLWAVLLHYFGIAAFVIDLPLF
jgi:Flp pilus assembly pilin Flp